MNITICGSLSFNEEFLKLKTELEGLGHTVAIPQSTLDGYDKTWWNELRTTNPNEFVRLSRERMMEHFEKIVWADAILVANYEKNEIPGYIGVNTLMEMGVAMHLGKKIFLLFEPTAEKSKEEIVPMLPVLLYQDVTKIM